MSNCELRRRSALKSNNDAADFLTRRRLHNERSFNAGKFPSLRQQHPYFCTDVITKRVSGRSLFSSVSLCQVLEMKNRALLIYSFIQIIDRSVLPRSIQSSKPNPQFSISDTWWRHANSRCAGFFSMTVAFHTTRLTRCA